MDKYRNIWTHRQAFSGQFKLMTRYFNKLIIATPRIYNIGIRANYGKSLYKKITLGSRAPWQEEEVDLGSTAARRAPFPC